MVLILYSLQRCLNYRHDLNNSSPSSLYSLVFDVPRIAPVIASATYIILNTFYLTAKWIILWLVVDKITLI